jgi:RND family efflux transporter MFP subunit
LKLTEAALLEAELNAEAKILNLEKMDGQMEQTWKAYYENERKFNSQHTLYLAGGINEESMRVAKFNMERELEQIHLAEKDLEIQYIGFREQDLIAAAIPVPDNNEDRKKAFIKLSTARIRAELLSAKEQCNAAEKELQSALLAQRELIIKSPARGIIASRAFEEGEKIKREDKIFTIIDSESLYVTISVQESEAFFIKKGMKASVSIDSISKKYEGRVDLISPVADSQSFTFSVRILLPKEALIDSIILENEVAAKPGMFAHASITLGEARPALTINENALFNKKNNEAFCFVVSGGTIIARRISLESGIEDEYIVSSGLSSDEIVVLYPEPGLQEGDCVSIIN